jgi:hypothetical protein
MKCVGAQNPPCARCSKVGRKCVVPPVNPGPRTISTYSSTESIKGLTSQTKARPVVYPLTPVIDARHDAPVSLHWEPSQGYSGMMQKIVPNMPELPLTRTNTPRPQTWDEVQRHPMLAIPTSWTCPSLQTPEMPPSHTQHIPSTTTPAPDVAVSSLSVPVTPLQHPSTVPTQSSQGLPSAEELSHLCRL